MRVAIYVALAVALAAFDPLRIEALLANTAAIILESLPYLCASHVLQRLLRGRAEALLAYVGCGCAAGPSARSIPAALATAFFFGPVVAGARLAVAAALSMRRKRTACAHSRPSLADELCGLAPVAALAAVATTYAPALGFSHVHPIVQWVCGLGLGLFAPPCALGTAALAAALRTTAAPAAWGMLFTAGFVDTRAWFVRRALPNNGGAFEFSALAFACTLASLLGGAGLVHPRIAVALAGCVPVCLHAAWKNRLRLNPVLVAIAALLVLALVIHTPPPSYRASETTLADAFVGERVDFTGVYVRSETGAMLERYAITCCRADAAPVAIALSRTYDVRAGTWMHAIGTIVRDGETLTLAAQRIDAVTPPNDPYIYR